MATPKKEHRNYKLDHTLKIKQDDPLYYVLENDIDLISNHIYLFGIEAYMYGGGSEASSEPGVEYVMANRFIRNLNMCMRRNPEVPLVIHMKTCFSRKTKIKLRDGYKKICDVKVGDFVLTHTGQYHKVIDTMSQFYDGEMIKIYYGRNKHGEQSLQATKEHPILVEREGKKIWIPINQVVIGDIIFVESNTCEKTGEKIPYWRRIKSYNADRLRRKGSGSGNEHLLNDIIPFTNKLIEEGWQAVPVGAGVIPDIVAFKNGKIVVYEIEKLKGKSLEVKKEKYNNALINNYIDDVIWENIGGKSLTVYPWYEYDEKNGFVKVKVTGVIKHKPKMKQMVYNLTVENDNSYVANKVVVHNCGGDWTEGMAIYDAIRSFPWPVTILNYTHARSMSSLIFQAGNKRVMMPNSYFMFHDGTVGLEGTVKQVRSSIRFEKKVADSTMLDIYAKAMKNGGELSQKTIQYLKKWLRNRMDKEEDVYLTAKEAIRYGFADEIFDADWSKLTVYTKEQLER